MLNLPQTFPTRQPRLALAPDPPEPDDLAEWLECQAAHYRVGGTKASRLVAILLELEADRVRRLYAGEDSALR